MLMSSGLESIMLQAGWLGPMYYILAFVVSALVPVIPTPLIAALGGKAFGFLPAIMYGLAGMSLGAFVALRLSRSLGRRLVLRFVNQKTWREWEMYLGIESVWVWGVLFFVLNVDFAVLLAGLTTLPLRKLWITVIVARLPWLLASAWFGGSILENDAVMIIAIILLFPILYALRKLRPVINNLLMRMNDRRQQQKLEPKRSMYAMGIAKFPKQKNLKTKSNSNDAMQDEL